MTREIALLSESPQAEVRVTLPQEPLDDNDDTGVETFILLLNDELGLAPANVFLGQSVVNIEDTGKRIIRCGRVYKEGPISVLVWTGLYRLSSLTLRIYIAYHTLVSSLPTKELLLLFLPLVAPPFLEIYRTIESSMNLACMALYLPCNMAERLHFEIITAATPPIFHSDSA